VTDADHDATAWLDEVHPHDDATARAQIDGLRLLLGDAPKHVLDLGCGTGRILLPLVECGHHVVGVDHNHGALDACRDELRARAQSAALHAMDFVRELPAFEAPLDCACILGNTFMTMADINVAVDVLTRIAALLTPDGMLVLDDLPGLFWPELTGGAWQEGVSEDGEAQLVWDDADALFALRTGDDVNVDDWTLRDDDRRFRLWTLGSLSLAARLAGLSAPRRHSAHALLIMRPSQPA
jgi:SAM-dependent methyltransferase